MKIQTIRILDKHIGIILCFILTLFRRCFAFFSFNRKSPIAKTQRILFVKLIEQGASVIAANTFLKALKQYGSDNVFIFVLKENRPILDILNLISKENIIELENKNFFSTAYRLIKILSKIRFLKIDTVIDMEFFSRASAIICYLSGAKKRIGYHRFNSEYSYRGDLFTHRIQYNPYIHMAYAYNLLLETSIFESLTQPLPKIEYLHSKNSIPKFEATTEDKNFISKKIQNLNSTPYKYLIILNPNASDLIPNRKWPSQNFEILIRNIINEIPETLIILTGLHSDIPKINELMKPYKSNNIISLAGELSLKELLTLYSMSNILITNDSGPGHFASLTDIHNIVLFGPETPILFAPISTNTHIIYANLACSPCVNVFNHRFSPCQDNLCMKKLHPDIIYKQIQEILLQIDRC